MNPRLRKISLIVVAMIVLLLISIMIPYGQSVNYYYDDLNRLIRID
jgi:hypothetical protein